MKVDLINRSQLNPLENINFMMNHHILAGKEVVDSETASKCDNHGADGLQK
jgi:hypothetical protein